MDEFPTIHSEHGSEVMGKQAIEIARYINQFGGQPVKQADIERHFHPKPVMEALTELLEKDCIKFPGNNPLLKAIYLSPEGERRLKAAGAFKQPFNPVEPGTTPERKRPGRPKKSAATPASTPADGA